WPGWAARKTEQALQEPVAVTMVADVGRSQPPRPNSDKDCGTPTHMSCHADKLDTYSRVLLPFVVDAAAHSSPVGKDCINNRAAPYPWITSSSPGNDNSFFNVSPGYGDHLLCTQTTEATALGFAATGNPTPYGTDANPPACPLYNGADAVPMGPAPQQSWPWGDGLATPSPPVSP